ncbi:MAG TPA: AtpZ/AtpI family protein [Longimicrobium sp.]|nr:AtpZ/AtpI family protein [Longimicrobium sp.]
MSENDSMPPRGGKQAARPAADLMGIGVQFVAVLLAFLFAGKWLDERLGTSPWLLMGGVFLGFGLSLLYIYRRLAIDPKDPRKGGR